MNFESGLSQGEEIKKPILKDNVEIYVDNEGRTKHRFIGEPIEGYDEPKKENNQTKEKRNISSGERKKMLNEAQNTEDILKAFDANEMIIGHDRTYNPEYFKELIRGIIDGKDETKLQFIEDVDNLHAAVKRIIKKELAKARNNFS